MEAKGLTPASLSRLAPGSMVLVRAKFKGVDSINSLAKLTVSNNPVSARLTDVIGEILPDEPIRTDIPPTVAPPPGESLLPEMSAHLDAEEEPAESPIPGPEDPRAEEVLRNGFRDEPVVAKGEEGGQDESGDCEHLADDSRTTLGRAPFPSGYRELTGGTPAGPGGPEAGEAEST